ncbi:MAG: phage baseplate assembly protein V, partial [Kofleriaceae bacterium]|nr:phage baseplate assembly protein V [Kofleriaceae bacterium]
MTQNQDPDTKINRIKVKLPWYDGGDTEQIDWVQLVVPMAGNEFGWYAVPDVGDQVMVMFVNGDLKMPVVLGGVWSKPDFDPETNADGKNNF